ncbi:bud emergence protein 1 [Friedmanniomyces endolithicus]|nr:bud emergence protein 1 [Friedmanniomyces endolithicus]KAK0780608.1 bud emergence protein 1 [Friedmanniomyces endolithicus]KAK0783094.1 bud emergence protein 1 [Friedmanniomyces endolithicus]KAK0811111.1 bud emergence protein 1 [Friedmanniomyces endolithicus]KAK0850481.1 bud emergence protein 1 [Friedmanniomyces endolithicus]
MKFRRSMKSDGSSKHDSAKPMQISVPQKDAMAIEPPKKVIKALYDYTAPAEPPIYLSFSAGDFLHVLSRENETDWYEACNPLANSRGLVPVEYFENVGKTVRDSVHSSSSANATHDSGYAEGATPTARSFGTSRSSAMNVGHADMPLMPGHRVSNSHGKRSVGIYGVMLYDFEAKESTELNVKAGEAMIVIAQSNPDWYIAKPITKLGGPGLVPVLYVEIRDMATGKAVDDRTTAVANAGIPSVEAWQRMALEYKDNCYNLGVITSNSQAQMVKGKERMSLSSQHQSSHGGHSRQPSQHTHQQQQEPGPIMPERASVPRYIFADDKFHFVVEARMSDGTHWDLERVYEDFYNLQINLINAFPEEAGLVPGRPRILPYMPGPVQFVTDGISEGRRENLDQYLRDLMRLQKYISRSLPVREFFVSKEHDYEVDPAAVNPDTHARPKDDRDRYSTVSQTSYQNGAYQSQGQMRQPSSTSAHQYSQSQASNNEGSYGHQRGPSTTNNNNNNNNGTHYRSPSAYGTAHSPPTTTPDTHTHSQQQQLPAASTTSLASGPAASQAPVKVKAWFDRDTCVVIRMPARGHFSYEELYRKIVERRRLEYKVLSGSGEEGEDLEIEYRDEKEGEYYRMEGEEDLEIALERNEKLTLAVRAAGS